MRITLDIPTDVAIVLRQFAAAIDRRLGAAAIDALRFGFIGFDYRSDDAGAAR